MSQGKAEKILVYNLYSQEVNIYPTLKAASNATGVGRTTLTSCLRGTRHNGHFYNNMLFFYQREFSELLLQTELSKIRKPITDDTAVEIYKDVTIDEGRWIGLYKVSNLGNVYSVKSNRLLTPSVGKFGYVSVSLYKDNKRKNQFIHRLVAHEFLEKDETRQHVNHINEIRSDNRACNLEYVTPLENNNSGNHSFSSVKARYSKIISVNVLSSNIREYETPEKAYEYTDVFTEDILLNCKTDICSKQCLRGFIFDFADGFNKDSVLSFINEHRINVTSAFNHKDRYDSIYPMVGISLFDGSIIEFVDDYEATENGYEFAINACNVNYYHSNIYKHHFWFYKKEDERWENLFGFEEKYKISNYGRIKNITTSKIIKPIMQNSYFVAHLHYGNKSLRSSVHTMVIESFLGKTVTDGYCVNHINECKTCNCLWNLEIVTYKQNTHHGNCTNKIAKSKMVPVVAYNLTEKGTIYADSIKELAKVLNISPSAVSLCIKDSNSTNKNYINGYCIYTQEAFLKLKTFPAPSDFDQLSVSEKITNSTKVPFVSVNKTTREVIYYDSYKDAINKGYSRGALCGACHGRYKNLGHLYKGNFWFFLSDFEKISSSQDESTLQFLKTEGGRKCGHSVIAISLINFDMLKFDSPKSCKNAGFDEWNVSKACRGKANNKSSSHLYKEHFWFYEEDYKRMIQSGLTISQMCNIITDIY